MILEALSVSGKAWPSIVKRLHTIPRKWHNSAVHETGLAYHDDKQYRYGAEGRTRTGTPLLTRNFKSLASTNSATSA